MLMHGFAKPIICGVQTIKTRSKNLRTASHFGSKHYSFDQKPRSQNPEPKTPKPKAHNFSDSKHIYFDTEHCTMWNGVRINLDTIKKSFKISQSSKLANFFSGIIKTCLCFMTIFFKCQKTLS